MWAAWWCFLGFAVGFTRGAGLKLPAPCSLTGDCPAKRSGIEKLAFVTLISGEESSGYVQGAAALATSLDAVNSTIARVCMVTDDVPKQSVEVLELRGYKVVEVKAVACRPSRSISVIRKTDAYNNYCTKVQIWTLTDYDKLIFLDADALVLRNIDHLFDLDSAFAVAPDSGCPEHGNTGVFVLQPSIEVHSDILRVNQAENSFDGTDQGLLNSYCNAIGSPWYFSGHDSPTCTRLPSAYNLNIDYTVDYLNLQFGTRPTAQPMALPHVIQFAGARVQKPWVAFAKAMKLYSEANDGATGGYVKPDYIYDEWWSFYIMWLYAFAGDVPMFRQLATVDAFARYDALLQSEMTVVSAQGDVDTGDDWDD